MYSWTDNEHDSQTSKYNPKKLANIVEGDSKAPFLIATTPSCRGGHYFFPWISPLYPWSIPYNAECKARRHQVPFFESLVWLDLEIELRSPGPLANTLTIMPMSGKYNPKYVVILQKSIMTRISPTISAFFFSYQNDQSEVSEFPYLNNHHWTHSKFFESSAHPAVIYSYCLFRGECQSVQHAVFKFLAE